MKRIACALAAFTALAPVSGIAEESAKAPRAMCAPTAQIQSMKGGVMLSRGGSFAELKAGAPLAAGDRILVRDGSANISVGQNSMKLASGSMVTISGKDGLVCAAQSVSNPGVVGQFGGNNDLLGGGVPWIPIAGLGAVGLGVGLAVGLQNNSNNPYNGFGVLPLPPLSAQ
ncbi:MAG: hypothetical protein CTY15_13190 [Methylocystis sp.]|nr:MAG: hypothetical protein CTY15_13190 [Methylocystis sp.]